MTNSIAVLVCPHCAAGPVTEVKTDIFVTSFGPVSDVEMVGNHPDLLLWFGHVGLETALERIRLVCVCVCKVSSPAIYSPQPSLFPAFGHARCH